VLRAHGPGGHEPTQQPSGRHEGDEPGENCGVKTRDPRGELSSGAAGPILPAGSRQGLPRRSPDERKDEPGEDEHAQRTQLNREKPHAESCSANNG
jgi:hypothetical protein